MLKGYAAEHVVFGLVQALRQRGMGVVRVQEHGREQADGEGARSALVTLRYFCARNALVAASSGRSLSARSARAISWV